MIEQLVIIRNSRYCMCRLFFSLSQFRVDVWCPGFTTGAVQRFHNSIKRLLVCYKPTTHPYITPTDQYVTTRDCKPDANFHEPLLIGAKSLVFQGWLVSLRSRFCPHNRRYMHFISHILSHTTIALSVQPIPSVLGYLMVEALH